MESAVGYITCKSYAKDLRYAVKLNLGRRLRQKWQGEAYEIYFLDDLELWAAFGL